MEVYIEKSKKFIGSHPVANLSYIGTDIAYYKILQTNRHLAIISPMGRNIHGINLVTICESKKEPLWKQDMQIRMGRMPRNIETRRTFNVHELTPEDASKYVVEVYEIIR